MILQDLRGSEGAWRELVRRRLSDDRIAPTTIDSLLRAATPREFDRHQVIATSDAPLAGILLDGYAAARTSDEAGHEFLLTVLRRGQAFAPPFGGKPVVPSIELVGLTRGVAATLSADSARHAAETDHAFALRLLDWRGSVIRRLLSRLEEIQFRPARERLAVVLLAYAPIFAAQPPLLPRWALAGLIGTSREMLGSVIRDFEAAGIVARSKRALVVLDEERLRDAARWDEGGWEHCLALRGPVGDDPLLDGAEVVPIQDDAGTATSI